MAVPQKVDPEASESSIDRDQFLIRQIAGGNHEAFAEIFDRMAPSVLGVLVRLLRRRSLAEEALQETFLQAWRQADRYRPELGSPRHWLLVIARSRGLDRLRRETARKQREGAFCQGSDAFDPVGTSRLERREQRIAIRNEVKRLTAPQQACLQLAFTQDLSHSAIAQQLSMPLGSVKSRIRMGMQKLGGMLSVKTRAPS